MNFSFTQAKQQVEAPPKNKNRVKSYFSRLYRRQGMPREINLKIAPILIQHLRGKSRVVYGSVSMNLQLPSFLRRPANDVDVKALNARQFAHKLEDAFERIEPGEQFKVEKLPVSGEDFNVFRVVYKPTEKVLVDASVPENSKLPPHVTIDGIKFKALQAIYQSKLEDVRNPEKKYRRRKDLRDLRRIEVALRNTRNRFPERILRR